MAGDPRIPQTPTPQDRLRDVTLADADLLDAWDATPETRGGFNDFGMPPSPRPASDAIGRRAPGVNDHNGMLAVAAILAPSLYLYLRTIRLLVHDLEVEPGGEEAALELLAPERHPRHAEEAREQRRGLPAPAPMTGRDRPQGRRAFTGRRWPAPGV